ncbi:MAG: sensor histidine kinase [Actinobacteria bacterium]|nr:sensor histidine kinase [Actinomycetota bacterium]
MKLALWVTGSALAAMGLVAFTALTPGSPVALLIVIAAVNLGALMGRRLTGKRPAFATNQRKMISLVEQTGPHLRMGLNPDTATRTARLLHDVMRLDAVGITDTERVLAFVGDGSDHHLVGASVDEGLTKRAMGTGELRVSSGIPAEECNGNARGCPLNAVIVAPLVCGEQAVGALKVYHREQATAGLIELTRGLAGMVSLQLELATAHREAELAKAVKLDALRAQMNPHFLFNTLNTISMKARTDPEEARRLLVKLSDFLRYAMKHTSNTTLFSEEYFFVRTYLFLEQARFGERLKVRYDVDPQCLSVRVPPLVIQPLVENAVKHGIADKTEGGAVQLKARLEPIGGILRIKVSDNGVGMATEEVDGLFSGGSEEVSALANIDERLSRMYGGGASLDVSSVPGRGTEVSLSLPIG